MHIHIGVLTGLAAYAMWLIIHFFHLTLAHAMGETPFGQALGYLA